MEFYSTCTHDKSINQGSALDNGWFLRGLLNPYLIDIGPNPTSLSWAQRTSAYRINTETRNFKRKTSTFMRKRGERQYLWYCLSGRVLYHRHIIPRLRHGLLSLRSIASFRRKNRNISHKIGQNLNQLDARPRVYTI